jgi:predicted small secreted protein
MAAAAAIAGHFCDVANGPRAAGSRDEAIDGTGLLIVLAAIAVAGCNTVQGIGKDIEKGGEAIQAGRLPSKDCHGKISARRTRGAARPRQRRHRRDHPEAVPEVDQAFGLWSQPVRRMALSGCRRAGQDNSQRPQNPTFVLNQPRYPGRTDPADARELRLRQLARARALGARGLRLPRADWAESFADIFFNNCFKNGILPIVLPPTRSIPVRASRRGDAGYRLVVDLEAQPSAVPMARCSAFDVDPFRRECLLNGWTTSA